MTSQSGNFCDSQSGIPSGVARGTPTYGTYGTDGESGCETSDLSEPNARTSTSPKSLAYPTNCRYCGELIYLAMCRDGKWRSFDTQTVPPAPFGVWAWRKTWGMEEQEHVQGKQLHYCARYQSPDLAPWDRR